MSSTAIKQLLKTNRIWQASDKKKARPALSSGYPELDQQLHYSGWPQGALSELLLSANGIGELRLLAPLMAKLSSQSGHICWINPPFQPYAPALSHLGIQLDKLIIINSHSDQDTVWAAQQAMNSKACSAVLTWLPQKSLSKEVRKLSLAAENSQCWGVVLRHHNLQTQSSAAALRIVLQPEASLQSRASLQQNVSQTMVEKKHLRLNQLSIIKQPGGWSGQQVLLNLFPESIYWNAQPASHWPSFVKKTSNKIEDSALTSNPTLAKSVAKNPPLDKSYFDNLHFDKSTSSTNHSFH